MSKATDNLVVRIAEGMISWLTFQQTAHRSIIYSEYLLYPPMFEIGAGRGWQVRCQIPLCENPRSTYDMQFVRQEVITNSNDATVSTPTQKKEAVAVEVKFIKPNRQFTGKIENDLRKLHLVKSNKQEYPLNIKPEVYEFIIGREVDIENAVKNTALENTYERLWKPYGDGKLKQDQIGWLVYGVGEIGYRYSVAVFKYQENWNDQNVIEDDEAPQDVEIVELKDDHI